jgi:hypothetical protein
MTVRVLIVDDKPDVEVLFGQQLRREIRDGRYKLDFALSAGAADASAKSASVDDLGLWRRGYGDHGAGARC